MKVNKFLLVILILFISIGFAILTVNLNINGSVGFKNGNFDVHFENLVIEDGSIEDGSAAIDGSTTINATGTLIKPGEYFNYSFYVVNAGTMETQLDSLSKTTLNDSQKEIFNYTVTYALDNKEVKVNDVLYPGQSRKINVHFEYKYDVNEIASPQQFNINITMKYINPQKLSSSNVFDYEYSGTEQIFYVKKSGDYKLEAWGASGGGVSDSIGGGYGGYSTGTVNLKNGDKLYINVGGVGETASSIESAKGGYNGGGSGGRGSAYYYGGSGGGGATHIATSTGLLADFDKKRDDLIIVAGGGGGTVGRFWYKLSPGSGGGFEGSNATSSYEYNSSTISNVSEGGTSSTGYKFGIGQNGRDGNGTSFGSEGNGGAGGGFYGGTTSQSVGTRTNVCGSGGSGSIANARLKDKTMYCYDCKSSNDSDTKTMTTKNISATPKSGYAKLENGHVRITYLG